MPLISDGCLKERLDRFLGRFHFEEGAVLVQIPQVPLKLLELNVARSCGYFIHPPVGLLYVSATFRALGIPTRLVDLSFEVLREAQKDDGDVDAVWRRALDEAMAAFRRPLIGVSFMFEPSYPEFKQVCEHARRCNRSACIVAGGVNATADPGRLLSEHLVDLVFSHEGEQTLEQFYSYVRGQSHEIPPNLNFCDVDGEVIRTPGAQGGGVEMDICAEYDRIPIRDYHSVGSLSNFSRMVGVDVPFATVLSRRGCRARCSFCGVRNFNGKGVRVRSVDGVIREMEWLYTRHGIRHFDWLDDDLLFDPSSSLALFRRMADRLPDITWQANNGLIASAITPELMDAIERSGCVGFKVGLESGNEDVLHRIHKPTNLPKFYAFADVAKSHPKIFVAVNLILGFPGETFGQMLDSFRAALRARLDWNNFYQYQHIKNTELYLTHGGLGDSEGALDHGKDVLPHNLNPVRGGHFRNYRLERGVLSGYDIFDVDPMSSPQRLQMKEIWFTFNSIANFLRMPALFTPSEARLRNSVRWLEVLSEAYPEDASMPSLIFYLHRRLGDLTPDRLTKVQDIAHARFRASEYWRFRDGQFGFSAFLDGALPEVPERWDKSTVAAAG